MTKPANDDTPETPTAEMKEAAKNAAQEAIEAAAETASPTPGIAELEKQAAQYKDQWMRSVADLDNLRKRAERDQQETARYAASSFAKDMINVMENVKRAADSISDEKRAESDLLKTVGDGLDLTVAELTTIFERHGIKRIDPMGERFDHDKHQAVAQIDHPNAAPGTVVQVVQAGYSMHDRLLCPAMVAVAKSPNGGETKQVDTVA